MHKILVIRIYFPLDALHVSDCISPSSGATLKSCTSHLVYAGTLVWLLCGCNHTTDRRIGIYQMGCTVYKVALEDGLTQSETCTAFNWKIKSNHRNSAHLVGLYTYCNMMHGAYNVKCTASIAQDM